MSECEHDRYVDRETIEGHIRILCRKCHNVLQDATPGWWGPFAPYAMTDQEVLDHFMELFGT